MFEKVKSFASSVKQKADAKMLAVPALATAVTAATSVVAFAEETGTSTLPSVAITTDMLTPLVEGVVANIGVILPVGLGLFAIFLGIRIIPGLISRFVHM